ncbi:MAG: GNAT family N-acetyltransferase [Pseudomonadota bacterium]
MLDIRLLEIRFATTLDANGILEAHRAAVLKTAADAYSPDILKSWAASLDRANVERMKRVIASQSELLLVADSGGTIAGFGSIVPKNEELRAVYVHPSFGGRGLGSRILIALFDLARQHHLRQLVMDASTNAEAFYLRHGFSSIERTEHTLQSGVRMACVKMRKLLVSGSEIKVSK